MGHLGLFQITKPASSPLTSKDATATGVCFGTLGARRLKPKGTLCRAKWGKSSIKGHPYFPTLRFFPSSKAFNFTTYQLSNNQTSLLSPPPFIPNKYQHGWMQLHYLLLWQLQRILQRMRILQSLNSPLSETVMRMDYFAVRPSTWATIVHRGWMSGSEHGTKLSIRDFFFDLILYPAG